jgi:hypothetical protein
MQKQDLLPIDSFFLSCYSPLKGLFDDKIQIFSREMPRSLPAGNLAGHKAFLIIIQNKPSSGLNHFMHLAKCIMRNLKIKAKGIILA